MVAVEDLQPGDRLAFQPPFDGRCFPEFAGIERTLGSIASGESRYRTAVTETFPSEWSYQVGLLLGYIMGDGCVSKGEYPTISIISDQVDRGDLERLRDIVATWCGTKAEVVTRKSMSGHSTLVPKKDEHNMQSNIGWRVKGLVKFVTDLGLDKSPPPELRRIPSGVFTASLEGVRGFISGMFSTDGSVLVGNGKIEVTLASVSEEMLREIQFLLFSGFGIRSSICPYRTSNEWRVEQGYRPLYKLGIISIPHVRTFAEKVGFFNVRKQQTLENELKLFENSDGNMRYPYVASVTPLPVDEPVYDLVDVGEEHQFVANGFSVSNCYATGGQYGTGNVQYAQALRFIWARQAINEPAVGPDGRPSTLFIETMVAAISGANFRLEGGGVAKKDLETDDADAEKPGEVRLPPEASGRRFFRIHDSGDFFTPEYLRQWKVVCERLPDITFWAPSRVWAAGGAWTDLVNQVNAPRAGSANNLIIRPSAFLVDGPSPTHLAPRSGAASGWVAGTTVVSFEDDGGPPAEVVAYVEGLEGRPMKMLGTVRPDPRYDWSCRAYSTGSTKTCRNAVAPPGHGGEDGKGCRVCWDVPQAIVNYHPH
jgi:hypothetical protein